MFALDLNSPIVITAIGIVTVVIGALIGPLILDKLRSEREKWKLRHGLYRELVHWYENVSWRIKSLDRHYSDMRFFESTTIELNSPIQFSHSIFQAEENPQIGRLDLKQKIIDLQNAFSALEDELLKTNLYAETLKDDEVMQHLYQLNDSEIISDCYDNFLQAFKYQIPPYRAIPRGRFLTSEEAKELSLLEARLDHLRGACAAFEFHEDHGDLDGSLLAAMRRGKKRGTLVNTAGTGRETSRWCISCGTYSDPWILGPQALVNELCEHCGEKLLSVSELSRNLERRNSDEKRKNAADALEKTYKYNTNELERENVDRLVAALQDTILEVRTNVAFALAHIGKGLEKLDTKQDNNADLKDDVLKENVVKALIKKLSDKREKTIMRQAAAIAIAQIYKNRRKAGVARMPLKRALQDSNDDIKRAAATAVGYIGDGGLFLSLERSLASAKSETSQEAIVIAMGRFGTKSLQKLLQVLQDDKKPTLARQAAASMLGSVGDPSGVWEPLYQLAN